MIENCEDQDLTSCVYDAIVVRGRTDRGITSASQMRVIAYEKGGLWYDAASGEETTEADARSAANAFVDEKPSDSPFYGGRIGTQRLRLSRNVQIG